MTDEELKKKIIEVLKDNTREAFSINGKSVSCYDIFAMQEAKINAIADALIAAGIGDVKEAERKAFVYSAEIAHLDNELKEAEHRAEVYYEALLSAAAYGDTPPDYYIEQAEKELAEEKKDD